MATPDSNGSIAKPNPNPNPNPEEQEQDTDPSSSADEDALIEKLDNVVLKSDESRDGDDEKDDDNGGVECTGLLPLRPYAGDCPHYVRNGTCKFGHTCRFNHPVKKTQLFVKGEDLVNDNSGTMECKYFSTAGGCKYGKSCRYSHRGEESENTVPELNFQGLPMRLGEKECEYYMRNGSCGYGSRCVYHHPDPISKESPNDMDGNFRRQVAHLSENRRGDSLYLSGASRPYQAPWSLHKSSETGGPYSESYLSPQWMGKQSNSNEYQAPSYPHRSRNLYPSPTANGSMRDTDVYVQLDEFPERPGAPECDYFMKTGNCKFKSTCRFHHPKNWMPKPGECVLSEKGLPLRPGKSICRHFERLGLCKFGPACLFDHPVSLGLSTYPNWPARGTAIASNDDGWED